MSYHQVLQQCQQLKSPYISRSDEEENIPMWCLGVAALCCLRSTWFMTSLNKVILARGRKHWARKCLFGKNTTQICFSSCSIIRASQLQQQQHRGEWQSRARHPDLVRKHTQGRAVSVQPQSGQIETWLEEGLGKTWTQPSRNVSSVPYYESTLEQSKSHWSQ